jgi:hypothetical protein
MTYSIDEECQSAEEFVEFFSKALFLKPRHVFDAYGIGMNGFIFRGQSDSKWPLLSSVFRPGNPLQDYTPQTAGIPADENFDPKRHLGWHLHAELRAVFIFLEAADKLGIETPLEYSNLKEHRDLINDALNSREANYDIPFPSHRILNEMALAQHHRIPTRLLDWTESPFVAAYFAAFNASTLVNEPEKVNSDKITVIFINTDKLRDDESNISIVNAPRRSNTFLRVQKGLFTYIPKANQYFIDNKKWPSLEDVLEINGTTTVNLNRVTLPSSQANQLLKQLYQHGITQSSLMPSLDNVAKSFKYTKRLFK